MTVMHSVATGRIRYQARPLIIVLGVVLACFWGGAAQAESSAAIQTRLLALQASYQQHQQAVDRIGKAPAGRLEAYFGLLPRLVRLEAEIDALEEALLALQSAADEPMMPRFRIRLARGKPGGPPVEGAVGDGDILAFSAEIDHPTFRDGPRATEISWQVYGPNWEVLKDAAKREPALESGVTRTYAFRIQLDKPRQGRHTVRAVHTLLENPEVKAAAEISFLVHDAVLIDEVLVTDRVDGRPHLDVLSREQVPHIYVRYRLADDTPFVDATLEVRDADSGQVIANSSRRRARDKRHYGITIEPERFRNGQSLTVTASVEGPDGRQRQQQAYFSVVADTRVHKAVIQLPARVDSGRSARFSVQVPDEFRPPYKADYRAPGLSLSHNNGLRGTLRGTTKGTLNTRVRVTITDADGRQARGSASVTIVAPQVSRPKVVTTTPPRSSQPRSSSVPAQESASSGPDPWKTLQQQLRQSQKELNQLKAQQQRELQELERQQRGSATSTQITPAWMTDSQGNTVGRDNKAAERACYAAAKACLVPCNQLTQRVRQMCAPGDARSECKQGARQATQCSDACAREQSQCLTRARQ